MKRRNKMGMMKEFRILLSGAMWSIWQSASLSAALSERSYLPWWKMSSCRPSEWLWAVLISQIGLSIWEKHQWLHWRKPKKWTCLSSLTDSFSIQSLISWSSLSWFSLWSARWTGLFRKKKPHRRAPVSSAKNPLPMMRPAVHTAQLFLMKQSNFLQDAFSVLREGFYRSFLTLFPLQTIIRKYASVAELVDAQDLGSCALRIRVRVPSLAPFSISRKTGGFLLQWKPLLTMLRPAKGVYFKTGYDFEIGYKEIL